MPQSNRKELSIDDVMCPICLDILIEPVTLACKHEMCKECYVYHFEKANFSCPICKKRLSTWARKAVAQGKLVNEEKWAKIRSEYPDLVQCREDGNCNPIFTSRSPVDFIIAKPGELKEEYLTLRQKWLIERTEEKRRQEEASLRLIDQIHEEEKLEMERKKRQQQENDEKLARKLSEDLEMNVSPSRVNKIILRPRRLLATLNENSQGAGTSRKRKASTMTTTPDKRSRTVLTNSSETSQT